MMDSGEYANLLKQLALLNEILYTVSLQINGYMSPEVAMENIKQLALDAINKEK